MRAIEGVRGETVAGLYFFLLCSLFYKTGLETLKYGNELRLMQTNHRQRSGQGYRPLSKAAIYVKTRRLYSNLSLFTAGAALVRNHF